MPMMRIDRPATFLCIGTTVPMMMVGRPGMVDLLLWPATVNLRLNLQI